eukprot:SAG11_NODE_126_length_15729_cov_9.966859_12_plen_177_part_00
MRRGATTSGWRTRTLPRWRPCFKNGAGMRAAALYSTSLVATSVFISANAHVYKANAPHMLWVIYCACVPCSRAEARIKLADALDFANADADAPQFSACHALRAMRQPPLVPSRVRQHMCPDICTCAGIFAVAAQAFGGAKPGYAFKVGAEGAGYYLDANAAAKAAKLKQAVVAAVR